MGSISLRKDPACCTAQSKYVNKNELIKAKIELPHDPAVLLLHMYLDKTIVQKDKCTPLFITSLFIIAKMWKQLKCPLMHKHDMVHIYNHKKE